MSKPKLTPQEQRDLEYHEWCRATLPAGWKLYGSTPGAGCSAWGPNERGSFKEFSHSALVEIALLRERIEKLEECVKAADALRFIPSYEYNLGVERFDAARAALGEVEREG